MTDTMNTKWKQRWVDALRSGDYEQGRGSLLSVNVAGKQTFCCLGVLCDIAAKEGVGEWTEGGFRSDPDAPVENQTLPRSLRNLVRLDDRNPSVEVYIDTEGHVIETLAELNDVYSLTFAEIADVIEGQL